MDELNYDDLCVIEFNQWIKYVKDNFSFALSNVDAAAWHGWIAGWNTGRKQLELNKWAPNFTHDKCEGEKS